MLLTSTRCKKDILIFVNHGQFTAACHESLPATQPSGAFSRPGEGNGHSEVAGKSHQSQSNLLWQGSLCELCREMAKHVELRTVTAMLLL